MPEFTVTVRFTMEHKFTGWKARDEAHAEERCQEMVEKWDGVIEAEVTEVEEE